MEIALIEFYKLYINKASKMEKMCYNAKYGLTAKLESIVLFLINIVIFLIFPNIISKLIFISIINFINLAVVVTLSGILDIDYRNYRYNEFEKKRMKRRREQREINDLKSECENKLNELRLIATLYNRYYEFHENILSLSRRIRIATSKLELEHLLNEIENNIIYIKRTQYEKQQQREQWQQQWQSSQTQQNDDVLSKYLKILGLNVNERNKDVIKSKRKELALKYHPDNKATGNLQKMQEINNAFDEIMKIIK